VSARSNSRGSREEPILCYVTDRKSLLPAAHPEPVPALVARIAAIAAAGVDWTQLREKDLSGKALAHLVREVARGTLSAFGDGRATARMIVNDRLDVALSESADGVHLGERSLPVDQARRLVESRRKETAVAQPVPKTFLLGVSCHSLESARSTAGQGADYIFFGPIFATPSKAAMGAPQGVANLEVVCRSVAIPVLAIGGITLENAAACITAGAAGIAAIRLFQDAADPAAIVKELRQRIA
jgi:thiamine-phosphate pyrophosphorylase